MEKAIDIQNGQEEIEAYGALKEGVHIAGYSFQRASDKLLWLVQEDRWKLCGFKTHKVQRI